VEAASRAATDALGARMAFAPELPKEPGGGAGCMCQHGRGRRGDPRRPVFSVGARGELKTQSGPLSSEGENVAVQAERSTPIFFLRSLEYSNALILNAITTTNFTIRGHLHGQQILPSEVIFMVNAIPALCDL
jgi:hypothetical protein